MCVLRGASEVSGRFHRKNIWSENLNKSVVSRAHVKAKFRPHGEISISFRIDALIWCVGLWGL